MSDYLTHPSSFPQIAPLEEPDDSHDGDCRECHAKAGQPCTRTCECDVCLHQMVLALDDQHVG